MLRVKLSKPSRLRRAFTLIELLIVIVVIAVLAALLVPAAGRAITSARIAGVVTEISQLESAIAKFKADHGIEPPSAITLYETGTDWNGTSTATVTSRALIQQMWPQFDFTKNRDLNNDGDLGATHQFYTLTPSECLVLFLGGMFTNSGTVTAPLYGMIGFSKDPTDPFAPAAAGVTREAPLFEFQTGRLIDFDGDKIPEYKDNLPSQKSPYLYYSSYDGVGYSSAEFLASPVVAPITYGLATWYVQGSGASAPAWKPSSHQLISPGYDGNYGNGGVYVTSGGANLPGTNRNYEADNITNFSSGVLQP